MYIALAILFIGIVAGRFLRSWISPPVIHKLINCAIFLLLFLLGVSIGANGELLGQLPVFGLRAMAITFFCVAGSIACCLALRRFLEKDK